MRDVRLLRHLPWIVLVLIFAAGTTLWLLFAAEQRSRLQMSFANEVERLADELLRSRLEGRLDWEDLPEGVGAFALYDARGSLVAEWGQNAPGRISANGMLPRSGHLTKEAEGWMGFVKPLQPLRPRVNFGGEDPLPPMPGPGLGMQGRKAQGYVYLRVQEGPLEARVWAWTLGGAAGTGVWAGFLAFVGVLWHRTRRFQEALDQHRELLQFAEASRTLSHELQNPLAAILLQTALLKRSAQGNVPSEVTVIEEEAQRMSALVTRVRDFLKDPRGQVETVDLGALVESLAERFSVPVEVRKEGPLGVKFDRHRLRSVVENLMKNAVESGPDPRPIVVVSRPKAGWARLEVLDSGSGFSADALKQAFQPFYTTKTTGTGIGLPIAESFVRAAGGKLKLENRPEGGARVVLDLPAPVEEPTP